MGRPRISVRLAAAVALAAGPLMAQGAIGAAQPRVVVPTSYFPLKKSK